VTNATNATNSTNAINTTQDENNSTASLNETLTLPPDILDYLDDDNTAPDKSSDG